MEGGVRVFVWDVAHNAARADSRRASGGLSVGYEEDRNGQKYARDSFNVCSYVILDSEPLLISDMSKHPTWKSHPRIFFSCSNLFPAPLRESPEAGLQPRKPAASSQQASRQQARQASSQQASRGLADWRPGEARTGRRAGFNSH